LHKFIIGLFSKKICCCYRRHWCGSTAGAKWSSTRVSDWLCIVFHATYYTCGDVWWLMFSRCVLNEVGCLMLAIDIERLLLQLHAVFDSCAHVIFTNLCWTLALLCMVLYHDLANVCHVLSFRACVLRLQGLYLLILYAMTSKWTYCLWPEDVYFAIGNWLYLGLVIIA